MQFTRDGARWHCDVTDRDSTGPPGEIGLSIARLISERVELASGAGAHTVRMTFVGAQRARQRIIDAASELFYQNGIRATGSRHDHLPCRCREGDVLPSLPREERPCHRLAATAGEPLVRRIRAELDARTESPASRLLSFFDLLGEWFARDDFRGCAFQNAAAETPEAAHAAQAGNP